MPCSYQGKQAIHQAEEENQPSHPTTVLQLWESWNTGLSERFEISFLGFFHRNDLFINDVMQIGVCSATF